MFFRELRMRRREEARIVGREDDDVVDEDWFDPDGFAFERRRTIRARLSQQDN